MKNIVLVICAIIFFFLTNNSFSQDLSIQVTPKNVTVDDKRSGEIEVIVNIGIPQYTFFLYNKEPWKNGKQLEKSDKTNLDKYVFKNLKSGNYFVGVLDENGKSTFQEVIIKASDD